MTHFPLHTPTVIILSYFTPHSHNMSHFALHIPVTIQPTVHSEQNGDNWELCTQVHTVQATHQLAQLRLALGRRRHSQVHVFVQFGCKVPGHLSTAIVVPVTLWYVINVMEDQTVPIQVLHGFLKTNVEKHGSVKGLGANLKEQRAP